MQIFNSSQYAAKAEDVVLIFELSSLDLEGIFGDDGHPGIGLDLDTWQNNVGNGHTKQGYWEWVHSKITN